MLWLMWWVNMLSMWAVNASVVHYTGSNISFWLNSWTDAAQKFSWVW
jgi:hypothetical protein